MSNSNWNTFTKKIPLTVTVEHLYQAWTTQEGLEKWFLRNAVFSKSDGTPRDRKDPIQQGDTFTWMWHGYPDTVYEKREVIHANGKDEIQFTFSGGCLVTMKAKSADGVTICELTQDRIPEDDNPKTNLYVGCGEGWTFYLANLKSILEGGIDLRNKSEQISGVINS